MKVELPVSEKLFWTMGNQNLSIGRAIAEFVDNSYDARINGSTEVFVQIQDEEIEVRDISSGMDLPSLINALIPAESRERPDTVGGYGFGLKTASAVLGDTLEITTTTSEMDVALYLKLVNPFDGESDMSKYKFAATWEIEILEMPKKFQHGTVITISDLRRPRHKNDVENVRNHLSKTFSKFFEKLSLFLHVNGVQVEPYNFDLYCFENFAFNVPNKYGEPCAVKGWVGVSKSLYKSTTAETENGYHLYLNGRLLDYNVWIGLGRHPEMRLLVGEIFMEGFKSNITKTEIIRDSYEYIMFEERFGIWLKENGIRSFIDSNTKEFTGSKGKNKRNNVTVKKKPIENHTKLEDSIVNPKSNQISQVSSDESKDGHENTNTKNNGSKIDEKSNTLTLEKNSAGILEVIRTARNDYLELELYIRKVKWRVVFKENGKSNLICDINHHDREMTLDSNHPLLRRYLQYVRISGQNASKHLLYCIFAVFNDENINKIGSNLLQRLDETIYFRGE